MSNSVTSLEPIWLKIKANLELKKRQINDEILGYPPPIPACDVQFNFLLEERAKIAQELRRLQEVSEDAAHNDDALASVRTFVESCKYIDDALGAKLVLAMDEAVR